MELADSSEKPMTDAPRDDLVLTVCICTYRRPQLRETLASLAAQALPPGVTMRVVVADNDEQDVRRGEIDQWFNELGLDGQYVHAPKRNISIARNSCLDSAQSRWVAFIDDDEVAPPDWLENLLSSRDNVECVFGVSRANYDGSGAPGWMVRGDFHSNIIRQRDGAANGYTCNVLFDADFVRRHGLRFREDLGQVGGEDTMFFRDMETAGARFGYNPEAVVHEDVPPGRANLRWLVNRRSVRAETTASCCSPREVARRHRRYVDRQGRAVFRYRALHPARSQPRRRQLSSRRAPLGRGAPCDGPGLPPGVRLIVS